MAQPVFKQLWYSSTIQRQGYQLMRSKASCRQSTGTEVNSNHSMAVAPAGGLISQMRTTQAVSKLSSPSALRGERKLTGCQLTLKWACRAAWLRCPACVHPWTEVDGLAPISSAAFHRSLRPDDDSGRSTNKNPPI